MNAPLPPPILAPGRPAAHPPGMSTADTAEPPTVMVGVGPLDPAAVLAVARFGARVELDPAAVAGMAATRLIIDALAEDPHPHYGTRPGSVRWPPCPSSRPAGPRCSCR